jgi:hypothetical protein
VVLPGHPQSPSNHIDLQSELEQRLKARNGSSLATHKFGYACAEPALLSNLLDMLGPVTKFGNIYTADHRGPPCGDMTADSGCNQMLSSFEAVDFGAEDAETLATQNLPKVIYDAYGNSVALGPAEVQDLDGRMFIGSSEW